MPEATLYTTDPATGYPCPAILLPNRCVPDPKIRHEFDNPGGTSGSKDSEPRSGHPRVEERLPEVEGEDGVFAKGKNEPEPESESGDTSGGKENVPNGGNPGSRKPQPSNQT